METQFKIGDLVVETNHNGLKLFLILDECVVNEYGYEEYHSLILIHYCNWFEKKLSRKVFNHKATTLKKYLRNKK